MKILIFLFLSINLFSCEIGDHISKCDLQSFTKQDGKYIYSDELEETTLIFKENKLVYKSSNLYANDIHTIQPEGTEINSQLGIVMNSGEKHITPFKSLKELFISLDKQLDTIVLAGGKIAITSAMETFNSNIIKTIVCSYSDHSTNCPNCNYLEGPVKHEDGCMYQTISKEK